MNGVYHAKSWTNIQDSDGDTHPVNLINYHDVYNFSWWSTWWSKETASAGAAFRAREPRNTVLAIQVSLDLVLKVYLSYSFVLQPPNTERQPRTSRLATPFLQARRSHLRQFISPPPPSFAPA